MRISNKETCLTCGYRRHIQNSEACMLLKIELPDQSFYCRDFSIEPILCSLCQTPIRNNKVQIFPELNLQVCPTCAPNLSKCATCASNRVECRFEADPSPMPMFITQTIQQPFGQIVQRVLNPDRITSLCPGCTCYNEADKSCFRRGQEGCNQWHCASTEDITN